MAVRLRTATCSVVFVVLLGLFAGCSQRSQPPLLPKPESSALFFQQTLSVGEQVALHIEGIRGSIAIRTGKEGSLVVRASGSGGPDSEKPEYTPLSLSQDGGAVTLTVPRAVKGWLGWLPEFVWPAPDPEPVRLTLAVPEATNVVLRDISGAVTVAAIKGSVSLDGGQVEANFSDIGGELTVHIQGGRVSLDGGGGGGPCRFTLGAAALWGRKLSCQSLEAKGERDLRLEDSDVAQRAALTTRAGEVHVDRLRAEALEGRTERGRIVLQESTVTGGVTLENGSGEVVVKRANAGTLLATATRGNVEFVEVQGSLAVHATQGKVTLRRVLARPLEVRAGTAEVLVSGELLESRGNRILTTGGSVTLYLRRESSLRLQADAGSGFLITDRALSPDENGPVQGKSTREINGGAVVLEVTTGGGDIVLRTGAPRF